MPSDTERAARQGGRLVEVKLDNVQAPLLDIREAVTQESFHSIKTELATKGNVEGALSIISPFVNHKNALSI